MVRFHLNGVWRKVIIDDTLPVDRSDRMLHEMHPQKGMQEKYSRSTLFVNY